MSTEFARRSRAEASLTTRAAHGADRRRVSFGQPDSMWCCSQVKFAQQNWHDKLSVILEEFPKVPLLLPLT